MLFYADENFPLDVVVELRNLGHDVLTVFEDGKANQKISDQEILKRANELGRVVLTINRIDFKRLHKANQKHSGIVICTFDADFIRQANRIDAACRDLSKMCGETIQVYRPS